MTQNIKYDSVNILFQTTLPEGGHLNRKGERVRKRQCLSTQICINRVTLDAILYYTNYIFVTSLKYLPDVRNVMYFRNI